MLTYSRNPPLALSLVQLQSPFKDIFHTFMREEKNSIVLSCNQRALGLAEVATFLASQSPQAQAQAQAQARLTGRPGQGQNCSWEITELSLNCHSKDSRVFYSQAWQQLAAVCPLEDQSEKGRGKRRWISRIPQ